MLMHEAFDMKKSEFAGNVHKIHKAALNDYKAAFKSVGAKPWPMDNIYRKPIRGSEHSFRVARPLTVMDSYPKAQKHSAALDAKVREIHRTRNVELEKNRRDHPREANAGLKRDYETNLKNHASRTRELIRWSKSKDPGTAANGQHLLKSNKPPKAPRYYKES